MTNLYQAQTLVAGHARELRSHAANDRRWRLSRRAVHAAGPATDLRLVAASPRTGEAAAESVAA